MTRWTQEQLTEYLDKQDYVTDPDEDMPDTGPESKLQGKITFWAKDNGYPCLSLKQSRKAAGFITPGWPDVVLVLKHRVLFLELKSASGELKKEQRQMAVRFFFLGHEIYKVKSYKRFMELVHGNGEKK